MWKSGVKEKCPIGTGLNKPAQYTQLSIASCKEEKFNYLQNTSDRHPNKTQWGQVITDVMT